MTNTSIGEYNKVVTKYSKGLLKISFLGNNIYSQIRNNGFIYTRFFFLRFKKMNVEELVRKINTIDQLKKGIAVKSIEINPKTEPSPKTTDKSKVFNGLNIKDIDKLFLKLQKYVTGRIDIQNYGSNNNNIEIIECSDTDITKKIVSVPVNNQGTGFILQSTKGQLSLKIKCIGNGTLNLRLRGVDYKYKEEIYKKRIPVYVDFTEFTVDNNKLINNQGKLISHDSPFHYKKDVSDGEIVSIDLHWNTI